MPIVHNVEQGTPAWLKLRLGVPTASEFDNLLTPEFKSRRGSQTWSTYVATKLAEATLGYPLRDLGAFSTEQGHLREEDAVPWYGFEYEVEVQRVGFITTDDGLAGCSPDGLIGADDGLEVKCPQPVKHFSYLIAGEVPKDYRPQVHGSLYVTGRKRWHFLSYHHDAQKLVVRVERDEEIMDRIAATLADFHADLAAAKERIKNLPK